MKGGDFTVSNILTATFSNFYILLWVVLLCNILHDSKVIGYITHTKLPR